MAGRQALLSLRGLQMGEADVEIVLEEMKQRFTIKKPLDWNRRWGEVGLHLRGARPGHEQQ